MSEKTVRLTKDHWVAGRKYLAGAVVAMDAKNADWVISQSGAVALDAVTKQPIIRTTSPPVRRGCCGGRWP